MDGRESKEKSTLWKPVRPYGVRFIYTVALVLVCQVLHMRTIAKCENASGFLCECTGGPHAAIPPGA